MSDVEDRLIKSVKQNPCLYNKANTGFRNRLRRDRAWASVSIECGLPVKKSQCKWKTLRDRFVREYHKFADAQMETSNWRYFNQLSFLLEHIKLRCCGTLDSNQMDLDDVDLSTKKLCYENDESNRSYSSPQPGKVDDNDDDAQTTNYSREEVALSDELYEKPQTGLEQAQEDFHKVMGLLENALEQKLEEQSPSAIHVIAASQDPFYKYLDSMLSRVDVQTRADIQLELLNFANTLVKNAKAQS